MTQLNENITFFAKTNFRSKEVPFGIKTDDRRRHLYVIGKTGMGKTTMMENMVVQDIYNGHGVCFIDPHGDSITKIMNFIPNSRINDVIYFNPADMEHPIAFNILEAVDPKYKHLVASGLMGVFTKIWANLWSARMEYILNNTILALLDSPGNTMLGIARMYIDKKYRKKIVDNIKDPMVRAFWTDEFANYNEKYRTEAIAPIQNKVGQFLSSAIIRNIVGQTRSTIDLREIMDNKKILLVDLSKGRVGEDNSELLGSMLITKLQLAALSRVDIPREEDRQDFYLYVDEFQNFVTDSFATILSEARKYRLNLVIGHQYIGQLVPERNNTKVRDAVFGNVGTIVSFRIGAEDAEMLEKEFAPIFTMTDIVNLPKYNIILKLMINGIASDPFSAITLPPNEAWRTGNAEKIIKVSRERYANPAAEVEDKISRWMGAEFHEQTALVVGQEQSDQEQMPQEQTPRQKQLQPEQAQVVELTSPPPSPSPALAPLPAAKNEISRPTEIPHSQKQPASANAEEVYSQQAPVKAGKKIAAKQQQTKPFFNRPQFSRPQSGGRRQDSGRRDRRPKPKQSLAKNEHPVWKMVRQIEQQKIQLPPLPVPASPSPAPPSTPPVPPAPPVQSTSEQNPTLPAQNPHIEAAQVIQPGEVHKF